MATLIFVVLVFTFLKLCRTQDNPVMYPYGPTMGDAAMGKVDDGSTVALPITVPFHFFDQIYSSLIVNTNGVVSFGVAITQYTSAPFPLADGRPFVAPFWADVDIRIAGNVYYRESKNSTQLQRATADVQRYFGITTFNATWLFIATWDKVAYYGSTTQKVNTFQAVLISNGIMGFSLLNYDVIVWTTGTASGGSRYTGLGGTQAQAGFNSGGPTRYFNIPGSRTADIVNVASTSNGRTPGVWAFRVDSFQSAGGCVFNGSFLTAGTTFWNTSSCQMKCQCLNTSKITCQKLPCTSYESCKVVANYYSCVATDKKTCLASGDPHYTSFDGRYFNFQGTCTYVLAQQCGNNPNLTYFRVEAKNENRGNTHVSWVQLVRVVTYDNEIVISKGLPGQIYLNGLIVRLPVTLLGGKLKAYQTGLAVAVSTDYGLDVTFNRLHHATVTILPNYVNATCGLCGTMNANVSDDFLTPNGTQASREALFGKSWRVVDGDPLCSDDYIAPTCSSQNQTLYNGSSYCGMMRLTTGAFASCLSVLSPESFISSCIYDMCADGGNQTTLCLSLEAYTERCQALSITVTQWRKAGFCAASCPANSQYQSCGTACQSSCTDSTASLYCTRPCREGCICNSSYILSGADCIPINSCGCSMNGQYYNLGEEVILTANCSQKCTCSNAAQDMVCVPYGCSFLQECKVVNGVRGCYPGKYGTCSGSGDPHYRSFDALHFDYQGTCKTTLSKYCGAAGNLSDFSIKVANEHRTSTRVAWTHSVEIRVYSEIVSIVVGQYGKVQINGSLVNLPISLESGRLLVYRSGSSAKLQTDFGLSVTYDWNQYVVVKVPIAYSGMLCGLCGDFNGISSDDFRGPNGTLLANASTFGNSWQDNNSLFHCLDTNSQPQCGQALQTQYRSAAYCGIMADPAGPFADCSRLADAGTLLENCVYDLCATDGDNQTFCDVLQNYAQQCQRGGFTVLQWRNLARCVLSCPNNSHYEICGSSCPSVCSALASASNCTTPCEEGCQCNSGYVLSGSDCVPTDQCGCTYNGQYYKAGEAFWQGSNCQTLCSCNGPTATVQCTNSSCSSAQICTTTKGVYGCFIIPDGICRAAGDPHYTGFDGLRFDFQGTCKSVLSEFSGAAGTLPFYRVEVKNENWPGLRVAIPKEVFLTAYDTVIHLMSDIRGKAEVNGVIVNVPASLIGGKIIIYQSGSYTVIKTDFGLKVNYDMVYSVFVTLSSQYWGQVDGLCGNFNGITADDLTILNGTVVTNAFLFGKSWVSDGSAGCNHGCSDSCPVCDESQLDQSKSACWIIENPIGPFSSCHSTIDPSPYFSDCVYDYCLIGANTTVLCQAIQSYAATCQTANVTISSWRTDSFCAIQCPQNSQYSQCGPRCQDFCSSSLVKPQCDTTCFEGCICNSGFKRSGDDCIPEAQCGCSNNGLYYNVGELIWLSGCSQRCRCDSTGSFRCMSASCDQGQQCAVKDGKLGCQSPWAICTVSGDPHYLSYDKSVTSFMGTCAYEVSQGASPSSGFSFRVVAENRRYQNPRVSFVYRVTIWLNSTDMSFTLIFEQGKIPLINGVKTTLPASLGSLANVTAVKSAISVITPFGVRIQYNGVNTLVIQVLAQYQNRLRGMCGNYNNDRSDDKMKPDGTLATSDAEFGNAWRADISSAGCLDDAGLTSSNETCVNLGAVQGNCSIITRPTGPFDECFWYEDAGPFFTSCVYDLCYYGTNKGMLCTAMSSYEQICNAHGLVIPDWRSELQCDDNCPENSHYELFGTGCPLTCASLNQSTPCTADSIDGCFCDEGYALLSGSCVPVSQCGCTMDGVYYSLGDEVFLTDTCSQKCTCVAQQMVCDAHTCAALEECKVMNGIRKCYPVSNGICFALGDTHYLTFDGVAFDYQGTCRYTLSKRSANITSLYDFSIMVQNEHRSSPLVASTSTVEVNVYGEQILIDSNDYGTIQINGSNYILPLSLQSGKIQAYFSGSCAVIVTDFDLVVSYDWWQHVSVQVPAAYSGSLIGLCGNFNGNKSDDYRIPDGSLVEDSVHFGNSWAAEDDENSAFHCIDTNNPPVCGDDMVAQYSTQDHCGIMKDPAGPFKEGINNDTEVYFKNCVYDMCGTDGDQQSLCDNVRIYAHYCQKRDIAIQPWRSLIGCDITCPANQQYELCGSSCPVTCANATAPTTCRTPCLEGCQCMSGFILSGTDCVSQSQCGCSDNGKYYQAGATFWKKDNCQTLCRCDGLSGTIQCSASTCATGESCTTVKGVYGCHVLPSGICRASGDPHYTTFDGKRFDFQGTCTYILSQFQGADGALPYFRVEVKNENYQGLRVAVTTQVFVSVYQNQIHLQSGNRGTVEINGVIQALPVTMNGGKIVVFKSGAYAVLKTDFGLTVYFDMVYSVFLTLPARYQGQVGGLCGDFNGLPADDFTTESGSVANNPFNFGSSWVSEASTGCDHGCSESCPVCPAEKLMPSKLACWIIQNPRGPFSSCHTKLDPAHYYSDCVYDHCLTQGNSSVLCQAIQTYAATCQAANMTIAGWRNSSFCAAECPANSHYELCRARCQDSCVASSLVPFCDATCSEGCFCDGGYLRSGDTCVKPDQCGCQHEGMYYNVGDLIWLSGCSQRCCCDSTGSFRCMNASCDQGQQCAVKDGNLGCQSPWAICSVSGDPHYHSYDKSVTNFMGTCAYEVSQGSSPSSGFSFRVVAENRRYQNPRVSFVYRVTIWLNSTGQSAKLVLEQGKEPLINGVKTQLPIQLGFLATVTAAKSAISMDTPFGFRIKYNGINAVWVQVGPQYQNQLRGMCGNCNGDRTDDKLKPDGTLASNDTEFGNSWKADISSAGCADDNGLVGTNDTCTNQGAIEGQCSIITRPSGPFNECHWYEDADPFFTSCVYDLCDYGTNKGMLCTAVRSYEESCNLHSLVIPDWRSELQCDDDCPEKSHYELFGTGCPLTCATFNQSSPCTADSIDGCFCDEGYALLSGSCIPVSQCGCTMDGVYYSLGDEVFLTDTCSQKCTCVAQQMVCDAHTCAALEECKVMNGIRKCYPVSNGICFALGDTHYLTFDGVAFDYQGTCRYTLSKRSANITSLYDFSIMVQNEHRSSPLVASTSTVEVNVYGEQILIDSNDYGTIQINGSNYILPLSLQSGKIQAYFSGSCAVIVTDFDLVVSYDWWQHVSVQVPAAYSGSLIGLCGNFNGNKSDDYRIPDGSLVEDSVSFGNSWAAEDDENSAFHCIDTNNSPVCGDDMVAQYSTQDHCGIMKDPAGPFKEGINNDTEVYFKNCVYDMCGTDVDQQSLCDNVRIYAHYCQKRGIAIQPWRSLIGCDITCPANQQYELCGSSCPVTCANATAPTTCRTPCLEGCQCMSGFILSGTDCVSQSQCGCSDNGKYYQAGATFWKKDNCQILCRCDGPSGTIQCSASTCATGESCTTVKGVYGCHVLPSGICRASGDPHYTTFDGKRFDFQGTCTYILSQFQGADGALPYFRVEVKNENYQGLRVAVTTQVFVSVYQNQIHLQSGNRGTVEINGVIQALPVTMNGGKIVVFKSGAYAVLKTDFGLTVYFDMVYSVFLTLHARYQGQVGGLCGDFNGLPADDFTTQSGSVANNPFNFGSSWVSEASAGCDHGCSESCPVCPAEKLMPSKLACWIIQNPRGPFSSCHTKLDPAHYYSDCVYDHCLTQGNSSVLCQAIQTYAATCQAANVTIAGWRNSSFCAAECPANSHYELCRTRCQDSCVASSLVPFCDATCSEGCFCDGGYLRSGDTCVKPDQCGCQHEGMYYNVGDLIWLSGCSQRCRCDSTGSFRCMNASCDQGQQCAVKDGNLGCQSPWAICSVSGDPHYHSYDKSVTNFMGTCAYEVSQGSSPSSGFSFRVVAENRCYQNPRVSFVYRVTIWLNSTGQSAKLVLEQGKDPTINGVKTQLPIQLGFLATVTAAKSAISVDTPFGFRIKYNGINAVWVQVGPQYQNQLRGMCGNYNGDRTDDKLKPDGTLASNDTEFGNSWKADISSAGCADDNGLVGTNDTCTNQGAIEGQCSIITRPSGPFDECHWYEDADPFFTSCVYDLCYYGTKKGMLCTAVRSYEETCNLRSLVIPDWRSELQCDDDCSEKSHYELFGTGCPLTCATLNQSSPCTADSIDGCFCDEGYALLSGSCVAISRCGCTMDGVYYSLGAEVFLTDTCSQKCTCVTQQMVCEAHTCAALEECKVMNGIRKCYPVSKGICFASGDLHYLTFDGAAFDYQGTCRYTLSKTSSNTGGLIDFSVMVQNENRMTPLMAWPHLVEVNVYGEQITVQSGEHGNVQVNGSQSLLPVSIQSGKIQAYFSGSSAVIVTDFGLVVSYDWWQHVSVQVPAAYSGSLIGLCGNFNGNKSDDYRIPNGSLVEDSVSFGNSWAAEDDENSAFHCIDTNNPPVCGDDMVAQYSTQNHCGIMKDPAGPFKEGINNDTEVYFKNCVYDMCGTDGDQQTLCDNVRIYAHHCQKTGIAIQPWRSLIGCELNCSSNQQYELCGSSCPSSCASVAVPATCGTPCAEGCQCMSGFVLSGTECVTQNQCGCTNNGNYYRAGDTFWKRDNCQTLCRCDGPSQTVQCSNSTCTNGEICTTVKGVYGCHVLPDGICRASGDPHYTSFDGRRFDFQGTCKYVLSEYCGTNETLPYYRVEVKNEQLQGLRVAVTKEVFVILNQTRIHLQSGRRASIMINGVTHTLPVNLNNGRIIIFRNGPYTVLRTDFDMTMNYDMVYSVFITLPARYQGQTRGLCGNFNGVASDDFTTPSGLVVNNAFTFGTSWLSEASPSCDHGCSVTCPTCPRENLMPSKSACWIIKNPRGPFSSCHEKVDPAHYYSDCVYDHCLTQGNSSVLCQAIQTYAATCQAANVTIASWRNSSFCGIQCPVNSHYELCHQQCQDSCFATSLLPHCGGACSEGCICDDGYMRSGDTCVKAEQCGCQHEGLYYEVGDLVWLSDCIQRCRCDFPGVFRCLSANCLQGQQCTIKNEKLGCHGDWELCMVSGDPHYLSYDGALTHFQGTCAYEITQTSNVVTGFSFRVVASNKHRGSSSVSFVYRVEVWLETNGASAHVILEQGKPVLIQEAVASLPAHLGSLGTVSKIGTMITVDTPFSVSIQYDGASTLVVRLGAQYQNNVRGLCGNYNGDQMDDKVMPSGLAAQSDVEFGNSWKANITVAGCQDDTGVDQPCPDLAAIEGHCNLITNPFGPFAECHWYAEPQACYTSCVYDLCMYGSTKEMLCDAATSFELICTAYGVIVLDWRTETQCTNLATTVAPTVPNNTIASTIVTTAPISSTVTLYETTVTSATPTTPATSTVTTSETTVTDTTHSTLANGTEATSEISVSSAAPTTLSSYSSATSETTPTTTPATPVSSTIGTSETLETTDGLCRVSGDHHYTSFDGRSFNFQGTCKYIMSEIPGMSGALPFFRVEVKVENWQDQSGDVTSAIFVTVNDTQIHLQRGIRGTVQVNGETENLPVRLHDGSVVVYRKGSYTVLQTDFGLTMNYDMECSAFVTLPTRYQGKTKGLCGNFNGVSSDDFTTPNGSLVDTALLFGESWISEVNAECDHGCSDNCPLANPDDLVKANSSCKIIADPNGPFSACHSHINPSTYAAECVHDVGLAVGNSTVLCWAIQTYVTACQAAGIPLQSWRNSSQFAIQCPGNSHYELCSDGRCQESCAASLVQPQCGPTCMEGCFCDPGYKRSGDICVKVEQCGCVHDGHYYNVGEHVWLSGCTQKCSCSSPGNFKCVNSSCTEDQQCAVKNAKLGCQDHLGVCTVTGDPHYITFDRATATFQGSCAYEVSKTTKSSSEFSFRVVAENRHRGNRMVSFVSRVEIWLTQNGVSMHIVVGQSRSVQVDGVVTPLPAVVGTLASITYSGRAVLVKTLKNLEVQYDGVSTLLVRAGPEYQNKITGMCGNFNGFRDDDKVLPDGTKTVIDQEFGNAWKSDNTPAGCKNEAQPPSWSPEDASPEAHHLCGIITNHTGPFEDCHWYEEPEPFYAACLYDLSLYGTDNVMVYSAIGSYEQVCNTHGITIPTWYPEGYKCLLDSCDIIACSDDEWCREADGKYACTHYEKPSPQDIYEFELICRGSHSSLSFSKTLLSANGIPAETLHLADPTCVGSLVDDRLLFPFGNFSQSCGSQLKVNSTHAIYTNAVEGHYIQQVGQIILKNKIIHIDFSCAYPLSINLSFLWAIHVVPSVLNMSLPGGQGSLEASIILYKDSSYSSLIPVCPVILAINERIYVSIEVNDIDTSQFVLQLGSCWATPTADPSSTPKFDLIKNGCPVSRNGSIRLEGDDLPTMKRFSFSVFEFLGGSHMIYIHCQVDLCNIRTSVCSSLCSSRTARAVQLNPAPGQIISVGPFVQLADTESNPQESSKSDKQRSTNGALPSAPYPPAVARLLLILVLCWLVIVVN